MTVDVLVERIDGGRFRAKTGEPFAVSAEGATDQEAVSRVQTALASSRGGITAHTSWESCWRRAWEAVCSASARARESSRGS